MPVIGFVDISFYINFLKILVFHLLIFQSACNNLMADPELINTVSEVQINVTNTSFSLR